MTYEVQLGINTGEPYTFVHINVSGETMDELRYKLGEEFAELANLAGASWVTAKAIVDLNLGGLGGAVETPTPAPAQPKPTPPWEKQAAPTTSDDSTPPWLRGKGAQPAPGAPAVSGNLNTLVVSLPYVDDDGTDPAVTDYLERRKKWAQNFYVEFRNSFKWDGAAKGYKFFRTPDAKTVAHLKATLAEYGGEIVSE